MIISRIFTDIDRARPAGRVSTTGYATEVPSIGMWRSVSPTAIGFGTTGLANFAPNVGGNETTHPAGAAPQCTKRTARHLGSRST